ncbi:TetR/AcrR family transcriptional regulator [Dyadobacter subterraneus]|uniref:TetR/AcrR family transcriptional regulator n=1 Tax=Dyadobacter subterraneus TaxID=2773304 RepID=A0ABR9WNH3_9BACT|nr:TetR/AcrR family transcriptional regulator [Dyadobacter subterraneus]MBE9466644.1 TetR/AcrR family transcriptional regulator [Dyadobacter subterraneus]
MGIIERKQRLKEETRTNILEAAVKIVKQEGWHALSMRKIADSIEYTVPVIYDYFSSKQAILLELTKKGFVSLSNSLKSSMLQHGDPRTKILGMWLTYWKFAFSEKEYYQLMFGVEMNCAHSECKIAESEIPCQLFKSVIRQIYKNLPDENEISAKYFTYWSIVHGLIALNFVNQGNSNDVSENILIDAISSINRSISA